MSDFADSPSRTDWSGLGADEAAQARADEAKVRRGFWRKLQRTVSHVPFAEDAVAAYYSVLDRDTPLKVKAILMGALAYFILPLDSIPDILPAIGFTDDAAVFLLAFQTLAGHIKPAHRDAARDTVEQLRRKDEANL